MYAIHKVIYDTCDGIFYFKNKVNAFNFPLIDSEEPKKTNIETIKWSKHNNDMYTFKTNELCDGCLVYYFQEIKTID